MSDVKELVKKLEQQVQDAQATASQIAEVAMTSDNHELKYYALTQMNTQYFGQNGLPQAVEKLKEFINSKK